MSTSTIIIPRPSTERGQADHHWLKTFHTFSFADYYDPNHDGFGSLRVINEDRVMPGTGFGAHSHREFEIFSYVVGGELEHRDSMGNVEVLKRGDVQLTSAGTGIRHSEKQHGKDAVHFLQIWAVPSKSRLQPKYFTRHFTDDEKKDKWVRIVAPTGSDGVIHEREAKGPVPVHSPVTVYATIVSPATMLSHTPTSSTKTTTTKDTVRKSYIHVIQTSGYNPLTSKGASVKVSGVGAEVELREGDGAYISCHDGEDLRVENVGDRAAEVVLFDVE